MAFKSFLVLKRKIEHGFAYENEKLSKHLRKQKLKWFCSVVIGVHKKGVRKMNIPY